VVEDEGTVGVESGAFVESLIRRHGGGRLWTAPGSPEFEAGRQWLQRAEGSAMLPLRLERHVLRLGGAGAPLHRRIDRELAQLQDFGDRSLQRRDRLLGDMFTGANAQMSFVGETAWGLRASDPSMDPCGRRCLSISRFRSSLGTAPRSG